MSEDRVAAMERKLAIAFPPMYRRILTQLTRGIPCRLMAPTEARRRFRTMRPAGPFPCSEGQAQAAMTRHARTGEPASGLRSPRKLLEGCWPLLIEGPGAVVCMVMAGPQAGLLWTGLDGFWIPRWGYRGDGLCHLDVLSLIEDDIEEGLRRTPGLMRVRDIDPSALRLQVERAGDPLRELLLRASPVLEELVLEKQPDLPAEVARFSNLRTLWLVGCGLRELPAELGRLTALETLKAGDNQLATLPASIGELTRLRQLDLARNPVASLPDSLGQLSGLEDLTLVETHLTVLPESLGDLSRLVTLDLRRSRIRRLPDSIGQLTSLRALMLEATPLESLPESLPRSGVQDLRIDGMTALDWEQAGQVLGRCTRLRILDISRASLAHLPEPLMALSSLQELRAFRMRLTRLPAWLSRLTSLRVLELGGNPISTLPEAIEQMPALQTLNLYAHEIPRAELDGLRRRRPDLTIVC
ncbi:MAG: leucine-rich repeat domain-containing protein [Deltaproteobacteria bacterium]|nr:leucine-rich repeat domain-containing protein [Deltaproteobacteria bacterium]